MAQAFTIICLAALGVLLYYETRRPRQRLYPKMVASTAFVAVALSLGALDTTFGKIMVTALVLSWFGDLFLALEGRGPFVAGLVSFLAAHVAFVAAFANRGIGDQFYIALVAVIVAAIPLGRWLMPKVPKELRGPIIAYIAVISAMVATAVATNAKIADWRIPTGAAAFYLSDIGVARDRFAAPGFINRVVGLPLYYGGQLLLAWAAGG